MLVLALQTAAEGGGQIEEIARTFGVDWPHLVAQIVSFGIVCAVLYLLAYKPILQILEARRQQIADGLANAEKIKAELARTEAERRDVLTKADAKRQAADRGGPRRGGARRAEETGRRSPPPSRSLAGRARPPSATARACSPSSRREVGRLVVQTTATVTGKVLTPDDHRRLAEETARQLR